MQSVADRSLSVYKWRLDLICKRRKLGLAIQSGLLSLEKHPLYLLQAVRVSLRIHTSFLIYSAMVAVVVEVVLRW